MAAVDVYFGVFGQCPDADRADGTRMKHDIGNWNLNPAETNSNKLHQQ